MRKKNRERTLHSKCIFFPAAITQVILDVKWFILNKMKVKWTGKTFVASGKCQPLWFTDQQDYLWVI